MVLRAVPMVRFRVQVPNQDAAAVTRRVAREGLLHLVDLAHGRVPGLAAPLVQIEELLAGFRDLSHRLRQLAQRLGAEIPELQGALAGDEALDFEAERARIEAELRPIEKAADADWRALADARDRHSRTEEAARQATLLAEARVEAERLLPLRFASVRLALASEAQASALESLLSAAPFALLPLSSRGERILFAVATPAANATALESALRFAACELVPTAAPLPEHALREAERAEQEAAAALLRRKEEAQPVLARLLPRADLALLLLQAQSQFSSAGRFTVLSGWLPAEDADRLRSALRETTQGRAVVEVEKPEDLPEAVRAGLRIPILHRNPLLLRPFLSLVRLYGTPSYQELEPTAFFALSFLLMFGLMFGDLGHGAVLFAAGFCLFRWIPRFFDYGILLMEGGAVSAIFGLLYGSAFGVEEWLPALWLRPIHDLPRFMSIAVTLGAVLVSLGLVLNVVNLWREGARATALFGANGLFGAFLYWVLLVLLARAFVPGDLSLPSWAIFAVSAVPILLLLARPLLGPRLARGRRETAARASGWLGLLEGGIELVDSLFSLFANTISFVRIAAFAAVHAGISLALFALADTVSHLRLGGVLSAVSLVIGNAGIVLLEGLVVSVQVLRLEYYEFFTRFFRGGGEPYRPLMLRPKGDPR
jgi:V/A-type H+-transporting ATPase subunit I